MDWKRLCEEFDYRFFTGMPFEGADEIYSGMESGIMHYVPAANEHIAVNLALGAWEAGFNSGSILAPKIIESLDMLFYTKLGLPILFISSGEYESKKFYVTSDMDRAINMINKNKWPIVLLV
jgi:hypothetical protein